MKYRSFFILMLLLVLLSGLASLISPILLSVWRELTQRRIVLLLCALIASVLIEITVIIVRERFSKGYNIANLKSMLNKYFRLSYDEINDNGPLKLMERVAQAVNNIYTFMTGDNILIWSGVLVMAVTAVLLAIQSPVIAAVMLVMVPVNYFGYKLLNKELSKRSEKLQRETAEGWQKIMSVAGQTDYLKQCDSHELLLRQLEPAMNQIYGNMADINMLGRGASKALSALNSIVQTMVIVLAVYRFMSGGFGAGTLILYTVLLPLYFGNLSLVTNANLSKRDMKISLDFLREWDRRQEPDGTVDIERIHDITLDIDALEIQGRRLAGGIRGRYKKGDIVWVQGDSGAGKSTLVKLLPKFRAGRTIRFNGTDLSEIKNSCVRRRIGYLSQNVPIIKGTLRENLFFNKAWDAGTEEKYRVEPILQSILNTKTMDTVIEEGGANLSGGEKQKLSIARALYDDVDVLILDEITSNIDKESAADIMSRILENSAGKITFIISHDPLPASYANISLPLTAGVP